jgi:hypothetical protein
MPFVRMRKANNTRNPAMAKDTLPAISESGASGEIAELYADIRQTLNVTAINYVWRHIATIDGGLRWAWEAARPMFVSGRVESEREHLLVQLSYPKLPVLSDTTLSLVGVSGDGRDTIGAILDTYTRGNLLNMVSLSALLAEPATPPAAEPPRADLPFTTLPLPPIPEVADLSDEVSEEVLVIEDTQQKALLHAAYLAGDLGPRPAGPVADRVRSTVHEFTDTVIARMIPIGQMLRQSLKGG